MEYIVIGGMVEVLHGGLRPTYDVDVCYARTPENLRRLADALSEIHPRLRGAPADVPFRLDETTLGRGGDFMLDTDLGALDLLGWVEPLGEYAALEPSAVELPFGEGVVPTLSVDALIAAGRHVDRPRDRTSVAELLAIKREPERGAQE